MRIKLFTLLVVSMAYPAFSQQEALPPGPVDCIFLYYRTVRDMARMQGNISVSFRARKVQIDELDKLARQQHRDRTQLLEEAIDQYLALEQLHLTKIEEGIADADGGEFASEKEVQAEFARWRKA